MEREYNCPVVMGRPKVSFRESIISSCEFDYLHKKQSGGSGQFGRVVGFLEPLPPHDNTRIQFQDETVGTNIPKTFVPHIEKGFRKACEKGWLTGNKVSGVKFRLVDGASHIVDSNEISFILAAQGAMRQTYEDGAWQILEPVMSVEVTCPTEFQGTVMGILNKRKGIITGTDDNEGWFVGMAEVPLNNMFGFSSELRSLTQGKGEFAMEYSRYSPAPQETQQELMALHQESLNQGQQAKKKKN
jgi:elongation factor G